MKKVSLFIFFVTLSLLFVATPVRAQLDRRELNEVSSQSALGRMVVQQISGEIHASDLGPHFRGGDSVVADEEYNGDLYIGAGTIQVPGTVNGDLIAAGGSISVDGIVTGDLRVSGGNIVVNGSVQGEVTVLGGNITFTKNSHVGGSIVVFGGSVTLLGTVQGNVYGGAGTVTLAGEIGQNVRLDSGSLTLPATASISGSLVATVGQESQLSPEAKIAGDREVKVREEAGDVSRKAEAATFFGAGVIGQFIFGSLMAIAGGSLLLYLIPNVCNRLATIVEENPVTAGGWGLMYIFLVPLLFIFLLITVIGIPLAFIILLIWIIDVIIAGWIAAYVVGRMIANQGNADWMSSQFSQLIIGVLVLNLIGILPIIGWIVKFVAFVIGMGALLIWMKAQLRNTDGKILARRTERARSVSVTNAAVRVSKRVKRTRKN